MLAELFAFFLFLSLASSTGVALAVDVISGSTHHEIALVGVLVTTSNWPGIHDIVGRKLADRWASNQR
jgi:hypothetical protein